MMAWMEKNVLPVAVKIGNQRHLLAVRDAFIGLIAVTMVGSFATLFNNLGGTKGFGWWPKMLDTVFGKGNASAVFSQLWWASLAAITIYIVVGIAYKLARSYGDEGFEAMFVALASYLVLVPQAVDVLVNEKTGETISAWGNFSWNFFNSTALFAGIIISLLATEVFVRLSRVKYLVVKMPEGVPPAVSRAFAKLFPGMITVTIFAIFYQIFQKAAILDTHTFNDLINKILVEPLSNGADSLPFAIGIVFLIHLFWIFGLHGNNILGGIITPLVTKLGTENTDLYHAKVTDLSQYNTLAGAFLDVFVYFGGSGATLGLLFALLVASKSRKQMVALGLPPGLFNINEPVTFGMPIVLNPIWIIPFILTPIVLVTIAYIAVSAGWVYPAVTTVPWTTPPIMGGYLATGGHLSGAILAAINLAISFVIYLPFVFMSNVADKKAMEAAVAAKESEDL